MHVRRLVALRRSTIRTIRFFRLTPHTVMAFKKLFTGLCLFLVLMLTAAQTAEQTNSLRVSTRPPQLLRVSSLRVVSALPMHAHTTHWPVL